MWSRMIVCKCLECRHHVSGSNCSLDSITISATGKCWSRQVTRERNETIKQNVSRFEFDVLMDRVKKLEGKV